MSAPRLGRIVVLGMMSKIPVPGVVWQTVHYLLGLERLGYDAYYVEAHARTPSMLMADEDDDSSALAAAFIAGVMDRFGLTGRWAFHALHEDGRCYGLSDGELARLYRDAALVINLHGGTEPLPEHASSGRLVYLETDPVELQIELHDGRPGTREFLEPHSAFFTFAENLDSADCLLPRSELFTFWPTRQPVVMDLWDAPPPLPPTAFTTIASWHQPWREVLLDGERYFWSKDREFLRFLGVPRRTGQPIELTLAGCDAGSRRLLEDHGWEVRDASALGDIDAYRSYIQGSRGEFTVAKDQNVRLRTGWFSDRSATYLASGRPVVMQDTGFGNVLPTGAGLFAYSDVDEAVDAIDRVNADPAAACRAATDVARSCFDSSVVLADLLQRVGLPSGSARTASRVEALPFRSDLSLVPRSKRPMRLAHDTVRAVHDKELPVPTSSRCHRSSRQPVRASVVVVSFGDLVWTRLCLDTVAATVGGDDEIIVVDNASDAGVLRYLEALSRADARVRVVGNDANLGFARAVNVGLGLVAGEVVVLLNNDTVTPAGWLDRLSDQVADSAAGLVSATTNTGLGPERIDTSYRTLGEMTSFADERARTFRGGWVRVPKVTFFCCAFRRSVLEAVGPLDERFEVGMFEDDDYSRRVQLAGLELRCAEDVFVHHFGEGTLGSLVASGEHAEIFRANRRRFEEKWHTAWEQHERRPSAAYADLVARFLRLAERAVPPGGEVLVVSRGDDQLLETTGRVARHFPAGPDGQWAGFHPGTTSDVTYALEAEHRRGAGFLAFPETARWWLDHYGGLAAFLETRYELVGADDAGLVFEWKGAQARAHATTGMSHRAVGGDEDP
ncbi:MAG: hypothetical protein JWN29_3067 [Acidimicrobiales bacterium]|nr:hypothetical protein [Acidimicrobiales bacterium]